jgi:hypothetical protein
MLNSKVKEILRAFCEGNFIVLPDPEPILNASIQKSPALAAVLLRGGQVFSALKPEFSAESSAILAVAPQDNSEASSALEFHLALLDPDDENSILILTQGLPAESRLLLVFPSETSLSVAEQCFKELRERLMTAESPQTVLMDFSELRLRQGGSAGADSWQAELFAQGPAPSSTPSTPAQKRTSLTAAKPYWFQVF